MAEKSDFKEEIVPETEGVLLSVSLAEYPHGGLIFAYACEQEDKSHKKMYRIAMISLNYLSGAFSKPNYIYDSKSKLDNIILYLNQFGVLMLFFNEITDRYSSKIYMLKSNDYGKTWDTKKELCEDNDGWYLYKRITRMLPDQLILPLYHPSFYRAMMVISADFFKTYSYSNCVEPACEDDDMDFDDDLDDDEQEPREPSDGNIKPIVFQVEPNNLLGYFVGKKDRRLVVADSYDFGYMWTEPQPTSIQLNSEEYDILALYDQYKETTKPKLGLLAIVEKYQSEESLGLYRATQFPDHWSTFKYLEKGTKNQIQCPYMIESINDEIHIVYILNQVQIKHVYFKKEIL